MSWRGRAQDTGTTEDHGPGERAVDVRTFRDLMSGFPSGVAVVTAVDDEGAPRGMTCTSLCSVGLCPPSLLVCLDNRSGTLRAAVSRGVFAVNLLHTGGRRAASVFGRPGPGPFTDVDWEPVGPHGLPRLVSDAHTTAVCRVLRTVPGGDHTVVLGAVEQVATVDGARPLLYGRRRYATWPAP
ncbi:flavin reductase family protein [Streptomyces sp. NPDC006997]|uniref:flavin reductase family protein n=1 Tax=Streptomyces sp. NPDC006997 TaxID=3155356 RepID=UPI0033C72355